MNVVRRIVNKSIAGDDVPLIISFLLDLLLVKLLLGDLSSIIGDILIQIVLIILQLFLQHQIVVTLYILWIRNKKVLLALSCNLQCSQSFIFFVFNIIELRIQLYFYFCRNGFYKSVHKLSVLLMREKCIASQWLFLLHNFVLFLKFKWINSLYAHFVSFIDIEHIFLDIGIILDLIYNQLALNSRQLWF